MHTRVRTSVCRQHKLLWLEEAQQLLNLQLLFSNLRLIAETPEDFIAAPDDSKQTKTFWTQPAVSALGHV